MRKRMELTLTRAMLFFCACVLRARKAEAGVIRDVAAKLVLRQQQQAAAAAAGGRVLEPHQPAVALLGPATRQRTSPGTRASILHVLLLAANDACSIRTRLLASRVSTRAT